MTPYAGPGGGDGSIRHFWEFLVPLFSNVFDTVFNSVAQILKVFTTTFRDLLDSDTGLSSWITEFITWILDVTGIDFLDFTPFDLLFGSLFSFIIVFTMYRYFRR